MAEKAEWIMHRGVKYVPQRDVVQARSEVLAAVHKEIAEVEKMITDNRNLGSYDELVDRLANLKPAAKDLEALLREAELKGRISGFEDMLGDCDGFKGDGWKFYAKEAIRTLRLSPAEILAELEKARASEGECVCEFDFAEGDGEESWHYTRECDNCGNIWAGLHCIHDGYQNPCPACGIRPTPIPEGPK